MNIGLSALETKLLETGMSSMTISEKNELISLIARKDGRSYFEINEAYVLQYHKNLKVDNVNTISDENIVKGFTSSNGYEYRTNRDDQINMIGKAVQLILVPTIEKVAYKSENFGYMMLPRDAWIKEVFLEGLTHKELKLHKYNTLKAQIDAATTEADLLLISWDGEALL